MSKQETDAVLEELKAIRKLMVVALNIHGVNQRQLPKILETRQATVSRMIPPSIRQGTA